MTPAWLKFLLTLLTVVAVSLCPRAYAAWLYLPAACVLAAAILARVSPWALVKRLFFLELFVLGVALMAFFVPGTLPDRAAHFGFLVTRCTISLAALIVFTASTPFADMLRLFQQMHVPALLVTTLALMHRYLFVLGDEAARMRRARQCRSFSGNRLTWRTVSTVVGQLFLRASERADRIYDAMCARGWRG